MVDEAPLVAKGSVIGICTELMMGWERKEGDEVSKERAKGKGQGEKESEEKR